MTVFRNHDLGAEQVILPMTIQLQLPQSSPARDAPMCITDVVQQAFSTGWLTLEAEDQLRSLLSHHYGHDDLCAFMSLQSAAMTGIVKQESRFPRPLSVSEVIDRSTV
jgi:phage tail protein X